MRVLVLLVLASALGACASFSTDPEAANVRVRQLCYIQREPDWVQIPEPSNAQTYRDAWIHDAEGGEPFRYPYVAPRWPEDEFWFRRPDGTTKLCLGNPFYREERCGAGTSVDFTESANGLSVSNYQVPVCIT